MRLHKETGPSSRMTPSATVDAMALFSATQSKIQPELPVEPPTREEGPAEDAGSSQLGDTFLASVSVLLLLTVAQKLIGFLRSIIVCRWLPAEELGQWAMMNSVILTVAPLVLLSIPACFGRFFEWYQQRAQLRGFLVQTAAICSAMLLVGVGSLILFREIVAEYTLSDRNQSQLIVYCGLAIIPFALFSFTTELAIALRCGRIASVATFIGAVTLAITSVGLLLYWQTTAVAIILAFGIAYSVPLLWILARLWVALAAMPVDKKPLPWASTWSMMLPVVLLYLVTDFITNLFYLADRYMLVNLIQGPADDVMTQIGNYESGHVLPILFSAVTLLIAKTLMPYLAKAWEVGDRDLVSQHVNLSIKLIACVSILGGLLFLPISGWLFDVLFQGKYQSGAEILPLVVYFYIGTGTTALIMNYFWCVRKASWSLVAMTIGVVGNIAVNYWLVPTMGIRGAAIGTAAAITAQLSILLLLAWYFGLRRDPGVVVMGLAGLLLLLDSSWAGLWVLGLTVLLFTPGVLNRQDWSKLREVGQRIWHHPRWSSR